MAKNVNFKKAEFYQIEKFRVPKTAKKGSCTTSTFSKIDFT